jgi:hypothetical protein
LRARALLFYLVAPSALLGLDDEPSWVIMSEHNIDEWPNGGL